MIVTLGPSEIVVFNCGVVVTSVVLLSSVPVFTAGVVEVSCAGIVAFVGTSELVVLYSDMVGGAMVVVLELTSSPVV